MDLVKLSKNQKSPEDSSPSDYPDVSEGKVGEASGEGKLVGSPAENNLDSSSFKVGQAKGESTAIKCDWAVDLSSGQTIPNAAKSGGY